VEEIGADAVALGSTNVVDLTELLLRSMRGKTPVAPAKKVGAKKAPTKAKKCSLR